MKPKEIYEGLLELAKKAGFTIRRESGRFKSGSCLLNEQQVIVLNRSMPIEALCKVLANNLAAHNVENLYIKPALREFIDKEAQLTEKIELEIEVEANQEELSKEEQIAQARKTFKEIKSERSKSQDETNIEH